MKKLIIGMVLCCTVEASLVAREYYISPKGSDEYAGSNQKPFATLIQARNAIREAGIAGLEPVNVILIDGIHLLNESFVLEPQDSGSEKAPVVYKALNEGKAIVSGATRITGLTWEQHEGDIIKARIPDDILWSCKFDAITVGDRKLHMARFPDFTGRGNFDGVTSLEEINKRAQNYRRPTTGFLHALHRSRWGSVHYRITGKDDKGLKLKGGWQQNRHRQLNSNNVMIENIFEELDDAGEWFLDRTTGTLYVYPEPDMDLKREPLHVTSVKDLIRFSGSARSPVRYVAIEGIEFRHARRVVMEPEKNWEPLNRGDWSIVRSGTVMLTGTEHCTVKNCFFNATGGNGVFFNNYNRHSAVIDCRFEKLGDSAVAFVGNHACTRSNPIGYENSIAYSKQDLTPGPKGNDFPKDCKMDGCLVFAIGRIGKQTAGCFISMAQNITVSHNTIYHVPRSGITVNDGCWGGHVIEYNDVFDTVIETGDHGPFNSWGRDRYWLTPHHGGKGYREDTTFAGETVPQIEAQRRSRLDCVRPIVIRNNRWIHNTESHSWGIDLDDGSSNYHVYNNLCLGCSVKLREGFYRRIENNIFIGGRAIQLHVPFDHNMDTICRNIVVPVKPETMPWRNDKKKIQDAEKIDNNLYWSSGQYRNPDLEHRQLKEYQAAGIDVHSISADPEFIDPANYDLRVADDSPALEQGFKNFPMDNFGVCKPEFRKIAELAHKTYQQFRPEQIWGASVSAKAKVSPRDPLATFGVSGGLVVCVGCDDPQFLVDLGKAGPTLVQGLDTDASKVEEATKFLELKGVYGKVVADVFDGKNLPYVDNLVNLLVVLESGCTIPGEEIDRILAPRGVGVIKRDRNTRLVSDLLHPTLKAGVDFVKFTKLVPGDIDDWTHFLHGADNNAVAEDSVVGPPRHIQWCSEPMWGRDHHAEKGTYPTVRTVLSSKGRLICLIDQTKSSDMKVPSQWAVVARDAFSGVLLWRQPVRLKTYAERRPKWGLEEVWRQLVVDQSHVYVAFSPDAPLSALDIDTGKVMRRYEGTSGFCEMIKDGNILFLVMPEHRIVAVDALTGKRLWLWGSSDDGEIIRLTLAAADGKTFVKTDRSVVCLSANGGKLVWRRELAQSEKRIKLYFPREKLIVKDGVILVSYAGKDPTVLNRDIQEFLGSHPRVREYGGKLAALSVEDGSVLWETAYLPNLEGAPGEIYVLDGVVWLGPDFAEPRDLYTGQIKRSRQIIDRLWTDGHHHRCYPGKATRRYIITAKRGIEMIDLNGENHSRNNWVRGTCRVGVTPCNGLIYAPPHSCGCYIEAKIFGFHALAPKRKAKNSESERLEKGPAYAQTSDLVSQVTDAEWPTYRGNNARSGWVRTNIPPILNNAWETHIGGRLSGLTVADGKVFVARVDTHTVHALDAVTGGQLWQFTAGARVDSPPTIYNGLVLFGSADGYIYCLRASDGERVWRFLAAPQKLNVVAFDQLESVWPIHGSVLVKNGVVYAAAGRCSYLDGGIMIYGLDPLTGKVIVKRLVESEHAGAMDPPLKGTKYASTIKIRQNTLDYKTFLAPDRSDAFSMHGATTDILVADKASIYLRHMRFNDRLEVETSGRPHLYSTSRLLDDWEHNRSYWILGTGDIARTPVAYPWIIRSDLAVPFGLMMVFDDKTVWAVRRGGAKKGNRASQRVLAIPKPDPSDKANFVPDFEKRTIGKNKIVGFTWRTDMSKRARAMLCAGDTLVIGGRDAKGGFLQTLSAGQGAVLDEQPLDASPVWDGLAVAADRLYAALENGTIVCLGGR